MANLQRTPPATPVNSSSITNTGSVNNKRIRTDDVEEDAQPLTLQAILQAMNDQFAQTLARIDNISDKIDTVKTELHGKLEVMANDISTIRAECATRFEANEAALRTLDERVGDISQEIDALANRNELVVSGIPHLKNENLMAYFKAMCKYVGLNDNNIPVDIRRLKAGIQNDGLVLVQFALRNNRDDFYGGYLKKRDIKLNHLGIDSLRRVYVNENLTVGARKIKAAALQLKRSGKVSGVYTKMGIVYIKRHDVQQPVAIRNGDQLNIYRS